LHLTLDPAHLAAKTRLTTSASLGKAEVPQLPFETPQGEPFVIDTDYFGGKRDTERPVPGPIEGVAAGKNTFKVWPQKQE
jgi:hypothetical protein